MKNSYNKKLARELYKRVVEFKGITRVPITGILFEELLYKALKSMGTNPKWDIGSHSPGCDITDEKLSFSVKSGKFSGKKTPKLSISSFRTTRFKTIEEKTNYFDNEKNFSHYIVITTDDNKDDDVNYGMYLIESDLFMAQSRKWEERKGDWRTIPNSSEYEIHVKKACSDQFWIYAEKEMLEKSNKVTKLFEMKIDGQSIGTTHKIVRA